MSMLFGWGGLSVCLLPSHRLKGAELLWRTPPDISPRTCWHEREAVMELQEFAWLCVVALFLASLLIVLTWLLQYLQSALRLWRATKTAGSDRGAPARQPLCFTLPHHSPGGGVWGFLRKLRPGRDGGAAAEAGVKGLFTSLFSFKSFREHWQRTWVKALNEQACRHGVSWTSSDLLVVNRRNGELLVAVCGRACLGLLPPSRSINS